MVAVSEEDHEKGVEEERMEAKEDSQLQIGLRGAQDSI